jgi:uncharacterized protein (TIGR00661 family)
VKILVCPLDWGLGHATRCIPLIRALQANDHEVMVGAGGGGLSLLETEFPELKVFSFPGYRVRYSHNPAYFLPIILMQLPALLMGFFREGRVLKRIIAECQPDVVISDGRYGVFTRSLPTIFITHQIYIRVPGHLPGVAWLQKVVLALNLNLLRRFTEIWVPDYSGPKNLSGELSHGLAKVTHLAFINPLSRFSQSDYSPSGQEVNPGEIPKIDVLAMVSGPEPQRGLFETALKRQLNKIPGTKVLIRGLPNAKASERNNKFTIVPNTLNEFPHLAGKDLAPLMANAKHIVARTGYTTVMELAALGVKSALLIPTPGQTEQEYLAHHLKATGICMTMQQEDLDLTQLDSQRDDYSGFISGNESFSLQEFIANHSLFKVNPAH